MNPFQQMVGHLYHKPDWGRILYLFKNTYVCKPWSVDETLNHVYHLHGLLFRQTYHGRNIIIHLCNLARW